MEQGNNTTTSTATMTSTIDAVPQMQSFAEMKVPFKLDSAGSNPSNIARIMSNGMVDKSKITSEEMAYFEKLTANITTKDINSIANFGSELSSITSRQSNAFLKNTRVNNLDDELGPLLIELTQNLNLIDASELAPVHGLKAFLQKIPVVNKLFGSVQKVLAKYDTIEKSVATIIQQIDAACILSIKDNTVLQTIMNTNLQYIKQIEECIIAGKLKEEEIIVKINEMQAHPQDFDTYEISDTQEFLRLLDRRIYDLTVMHACMKQTIPQIRMIQRGNIEAHQTAQTMKTLSIPTWQTHLSMMIELKRQGSRAKALKAVNDTTNAILKRNADLLRENIVAITKEHERDLVDPETLKHSTEQLLATINEVREIRTAAAKRRQEQVAELSKIEATIEAALVSDSNLMNHLIN